MSLVIYRNSRAGLGVGGSEVREQSPLDKVVIWDFIAAARPGETEFPVNFAAGFFWVCPPRPFNSLS